MKVINTNKERYVLFCQQNKKVPLFMQAWWMDAVCNYKNWDVLFYEKNNKIIAVWVYHFVKKFGLKLIIQPQLTQINGIWIDYPDNLSSNEIVSFDKIVMTDLLNQFKNEKFSYYDQNFHYSIKNWLPFYWRDFKQTTRYTYQINDISNPLKCLEEFSYAKRKQIKKSNNNFKCDFELSGEDFYKHVKLNLNALGKKVNYSNELFLRIYNSCVSRNQGCIISAFDENENLHAALFIVWDQNSAFNLISTINPKFKSSGASTFVVWEAIKAMSNNTQIFDFEGSMSENIENSFRQFGTNQVPYFRIIKQKSLFLKLVFRLKRWK
jgi:hypothetical protein